MKKVLSVILAALMLLAMIPVVYAASTPKITTTVDKTNIKANDIVTLTASISANSNICSLEYEIYYDNTEFAVISDSISCKKVFNSYESANATSSKIKFVGASAYSVSNSSQVFLTVQFRALKSSGKISVAVTEAHVTADNYGETNVTKEVNKVSEKTFTFPSNTSTKYLNMRTPSETTIRYKDGIVLHADAIRTLPSGYKITWTTSNSNFKTTPSADGKTLTIISNSKGDTDITATLYNSSGAKLDSVTITMTSKAGFFDKIGGFFRSLFGTTKIYSE